MWNILRTAFLKNTSGGCFFNTLRGKCPNTEFFWSVLSRCDIIEVISFLNISKCRPSSLYASKEMNYRLSHFTLFKQKIILELQLRDIIEAWKYLYFHNFETLQNIASEDFKRRKCYRQEKPKESAIFQTAAKQLWNELAHACYSNNNFKSTCSSNMAFPSRHLLVQS